ncbi:hypothetical protein ES703_04166 [subsurface metagenome]
MVILAFDEDTPDAAIDEIVAAHKGKGLASLRFWYAKRILDIEENVIRYDVVRR